MRDDLGVALEAAELSGLRAGRVRLKQEDERMKKQQRIPRDAL